MYVSCEPGFGIHAPLNGVFALSGTGISDYTKIFCTCGRITDIDTQTYRRRLGMHKQIECVHCRNARISAEFEKLDEHYGVIEGEEIL